ncbi:MAG: hypothetical protein U0414_00835 [Polyangiaceae bacterium]
MKTTAVDLLLAAVALAACGSSRSPTPTPTSASASAATSSAPLIVPPFSAAQPAPSPVCIITGAGGFAAGHPLWTVAMEGQGQLLFVGDVDKTSLKVKPRLVVRAEPEDVAVFAGRPELLAVKSAFGTNVLSGESELTPLPESGSLAASADGKLLAVRTFEGLAVYDVATFTQRFSSPLEIGSDSIDLVSDDYVVCGGNGRSQWTAVLDQHTGKVLAQERGIGSLSPSKKTLAILGQENARLRLLKLGPRAKMSTIDVALTGEVMHASELVFDTNYVDLVAHGRRGEDRVLARFVTDTGAMVQVPPAPETATSQAIDDGGNAVAEKDLDVKARALLPMDRSFLGQTTQRKRGFVGPTSSGFFAAGTVSKDPAATPSVQGLLIGNTLAQKVLHTVLLPPGFSIEAMATTTASSSSTAATWGSSSTRSPGEPPSRTSCSAVRTPGSRGR